MHEDIQEVIDSAKENRRAVIEGNRTVKEANSINNANHTIVMAHTLDLRKRMFEAEIAGQIARTEDRDRIESKSEAA